MKFWIYEETRREWKEKKNVLTALSTVSISDWHGQILLTSQRPDRDKEAICAALQIIRKIRNDVTVIVGMPHPTIPIAEEFRNSGAKELWAIDLKYAHWATIPSINSTDRMLLDHPICPALHIQAGEPCELSVCGKRNNRLILVMRHFRKWCLSDYESCPYWRDEYNDS